LGHAVAASACVPGLFEPITFDALYPSRVVRLVDGGVHDNQGTASLLENQCNVLLVSDASGQMETEDTPSSGLLGVPLRSNSILQARVRQAQYHELDARRSTLLLRGLMFVHLKKDLDVDPVDWVNCEDPYDASDESRSVLRRGELTTYGIRKDVQRCLAAVRTDLDSFSEVEAWALMTSGYRMTEREFPATIAGFDGTAVAAREPWRFLAVELPMQQRQGVDAAHEELMKLLGVSNALSLKVWKLSPALRLARAVALGLLALGYLAWCVGAIGANFDTIEVSQRSVGIFGLVLAAIPVVLAIARRLRFPGMQIGSSIFRAASGLSIGLVGWAFAWIHLAFFDPWYLRLGRVERLGLSTGDGVRTGRGSKRLAWTIFGLLVVVIGGFLAYPHYMAQTPTDTSMALIAGSYAKRQAGNYAGAIADLSQGLESPKSKWTAQMYRDRAYCYRLQGNWEKSIADLTTALGMEAGGSQGMLSLLKQRAFAYVQVRDPELALKDYDAALNILPGDAEAKLGQFSLGLVLREPVAKPPFRVIVGQAIDSSEKLPLAVLLLQPKFTKFLTLGWWWNPIPASELRYTDSEDAVLAGDIVATLRSRGVQVNGPILMGGTGRSRHFELWLSTTIEKAPSGSRTASPSSSVDGLDVKR
jgi:hypothetical protein